MTRTVTLDQIADAMTAQGMRAYVENIGGGVLAVVDYGGFTVTVNDGQRAAECSPEDPARFEICRNGYTVASGELWTGDAREVAAVVASTSWA